MMIKIASGRRLSWPKAALFGCLLLSAGQTMAWQQEFVFDNTRTEPGQRFTWDSTHQPSYNDILAERIEAYDVDNLTPGVTHITPPPSIARDTSGMGVGINIPLTKMVSTGPTATLRMDGNSASIYNEYGDSVITPNFSDPLQHANISTLGWRVNYNLGDVRPWAQISYSRQFGDNQWRAQPGMNLSASPVGLEGSWRDVAVGADMPLGHHLAAWASLSQAEGAVDGSLYLYSMGVSARF